VNMCTVKKPTFLLAVLLLVAALCLADTTHEGNWSNPFCYRNVFNQSDHIAEVERVTLQRVTPEFVTSRMHRGQPYIVSGVTKGWPANHKWSHDYFERLFSGHELFSSTFSTPTSPDFSDIISAHETYYGIFLNSRDSARLVSTDYSYPSFIPPEWRITGNEWLHWGFPPCGAKRHMDIMCTSRLSVQVMGEKLWRLYPVTMATSTRHWNWTSLLQPLQATLYPGDVIVWFPGWEHATSIQVGPSISLSLHFTSPQNSIYQNTFSEELSQRVSDECPWKH
ncbi:hypothetical protein EMCRGX_G027127, partial [Ephydatia muelleri]